MTKSATSRPSRFPAVRSKRKCCPAKTRLNVASSAAAERLLNERSTPGRTSEDTLKLKWSEPENSARFYPPSFSDGLPGDTGQADARKSEPREYRFNNP